MNINTSIAKRIRELLKQKQLTIYKLEKLSCVSHSTMMCVLSSKYENCKIKTLCLIIESLEITISEFFDSPLFNLREIDLF